MISLAGTNLVKDRMEGVVGQRLHLFIGAVLNRMRHEDTRWVESERLRLGLSCLSKLDRGDEHGRHAPVFQFHDVVHTARGARPSIGQRFDHHITLRGNFLA